MFRKFIITVLILSPFILLLIGYPLKENHISNMNYLHTSNRCFTTGDVGQYVSCLNNQKLGGIQMMSIIFTDLHNENSLFGFLFILFIFLQIPLVYFIANDIEKEN